LEDPEAPELFARALELEPFWLRARVLELLAVARELFERACEALDLVRALLAFPFEALGPFFALEPLDDVARLACDDAFPLLEPALAWGIRGSPPPVQLPLLPPEKYPFRRGRKRD
jgi:hypothetical protein